MEKEFIPYNEALALKGLGFDEPCIKYYWTDGMFTKTYEAPFNHNKRDNLISAPTFSQAFRFFRENYRMKIWFNISQQVPYVDKYLVSIDVYDGFGVGTEFEEEFSTYEEAELECLKKLIEIVKTIQQ